MLRGTPRSARITPRRLTYLRGSTPRVTVSTPVTMVKSVKRKRYKTKKKARQANRRSFRREVGESKSTQPLAKRTTVTSEELTLRASRSLRMYPLLVVDRNTTGNDIDKRNRDAIYVSGVQINWLHRNLLVNEPLYVNVAIIKWKGQTGFPSQSAPTDYTSFGDWFRDDQGVSRSRDFAGNLTVDRYHYLPLNSDNMHIYMHKKFVLTGESETATAMASNKGSSWKQQRFWIPIKRKIVFDGPTETTPADGQIHAVVWYTRVLSFSITGQTPDVCQASFRSVVHFRDLPS